MCMHLHTLGGSFRHFPMASGTRAPILCTPHSPTLSQWSCWYQPWQIHLSTWTHDILRGKTLAVFWTGMYGYTNMLMFEADPF